MTVKLKRALGCFSSGWNPVFFNYMAHRRHSNTQNCERKSIRGHSYWLNLPCLLASCPISCQNSKKLSSPSLFLSNELIRWSMAAGSSAFCRKTGNHMYPILKKNRLSPWIMQKIRLTLVMCMEREIRGKQYTLACKRVKKKNHASSAEVVWHRTLLTLSPSSGHCDYYNYSNKKKHVEFSTLWVKQTFILRTCRAQTRQSQQRNTFFFEGGTFSVKH